MRFIGKYWVNVPFVWCLFVSELLFTIAILALFGIADPYTYRGKLWQEGSNHGWNSNPNEILYSYANHRPMKTPVVWSKWLNNYNVVISVLSMFLLLTKVTMMTMAVWWPPLSVIIHAILIGLYTYSAYAQASPDMSDPLHPQPGAPWYITKSCDAVKGSSIKDIVGYCGQAKAAFAMTIILLFIFFVNLCWATYSNFYGKKPVESDPDDDDFGPAAGGAGKGVSSDYVSTKEQQWEMQNYGGIPAAYGAANVPFTPRTQAFHQLGGQPTQQAGRTVSHESSGRSIHEPGGQSDLPLRQV